jgi:hypothetical protein
LEAETMSVLMTDEPVDTNCPLCSKPLDSERFFHLHCAREENARADFEGEGNEPAMSAAAEDRMTYDRRA